jgi:pimeloyl-ACP methyl ester carboxylesterase
MVRQARHVTAIGEQRIAWLEAGPETAGPALARSPVVLVHGLGTSEAWWSRTVPVLAARYRVLAVDLVGFGRSAGQPVRLDAAADQLAAWAAAIELERATFVGHSMGGLVVADLAARRPDLVERLVLVDAAGLAVSQRVTRHLLNVLRGGPHLPPRAYPVAVGCVLRCGPLAIARAAHQILASDLEERIRRVQAPTLVVWGARDRLLPPSFGRRLAATIPGAAFVELEHAGHSPMWEQPAEFERTLEAFLEEPAPDRAPAPARRAGRTLTSPAPPSLAPGTPITDPTGGRVVSRYLPVGDWSIHMRVGRPDGPAASPETPPIVFVHGYVMASRTNLPTLGRLAARHLVVAPDLPGFGWSTKPARPLDVPELAAALVATMEAAGIGRAVLVGSSLGSQVVAQAAADHPDRVLGVVLVGPTFDPAEPKAGGQLRRFLAALAGEWPAVWFEHLRDLVLAGPPRSIATFRNGLAHRIDRVLPDVHVPAVVVRGGRDPVVPRTWARAAAALLPNGRALEIRGSGRIVGYGAPAALARIVEEHVAAVASVARPHGDGTMPMHIVTAVHRRRPAARPRRARAGPPRT